MAMLRVLLRENRAGDTTWGVLFLSKDGQYFVPMPSQAEAKKLMRIVENGVLAERRDAAGFVMKKAEGRVLTLLRGKS